MIALYRKLFRKGGGVPSEAYKAIASKVASRILGQPQERICVNCKHCIPSSTAPKYVTCAQAPEIDKVTGDKTYSFCQTMRTYSSRSCGPDGSLFEEKE